MASTSVIDDAPLKPFHRKVRWQCAGGTFLDGYLISSMAVALPGASVALQLGTIELSLLAVSALVGIFFGSLLCGALSDRIGRHKLFLIDLVSFAVFSAMSLFAEQAWQLILLRLLVGVAIGADYPLAMTMVTEWLPTRHRAAGIGVLVMSWFGGAAAANIIGFLIIAAFGEQAWAWVLASATVPAAITILLRIGMPESPRWLISKGRTDEALAIMRSVFGPKTTLDGLQPARAEQANRRQFRTLLRPPYLKRTLFASGPYTAQTTAFFVVLTFEPTILHAFGFDHGNVSYLGAALTSLLFLIGCIPVLRWAETRGRRTLYIGSFALMCLPLLVLGVFPITSAAVVIACFSAYALVSGPTNVLSWSYPNELFPTHLRATGVGFATAMTRIGAAAGTFLLPILLEQIGTGPTMLVGLAVVASGLLMCVLWAPETSGKSLDETSSLMSPALPEPEAKSAD
ncbi:MAG: MFS transporter [Pseudonocardiaceae bacterium]|nr:MFS transporter [Pseudonocardiaceae bacterium]